MLQVAAALPVSRGLQDGLRVDGDAVVEVLQADPARQSCAGRDTPLELAIFGPGLFFSGGSRGRPVGIGTAGVDVAHVL